MTAEALGRIARNVLIGFFQMAQPDNQGGFIEASFRRC
jgi:hypothetical protein